MTVFLVVMGCLYACIAAVILSKAPEAGVQMSLWSTPILSICLWAHVREQIAVARRALLPGAMPPVLLIFLLLAALLVFACPTVTALYNGPSVSGLLACAMFFFAVAGRWALSGKWRWLIGGEAVWMGLVFGSQSTPIASFITGKDEPAAMSVFVVALGAAVLAMYRMCRLNEEDSSYYRGLTDLRFSWLRPRMTGQTQEAWHRQKAMGASTWSAKNMIIPADGGFVSRVWAWSRLGRGGVFFHSFMAGSVFVVQFLMFRFQPDASGPSEMILFIWILFMPTLMTVAGWLQMWTFLEADSLRPIRRGRFLTELSAAIAVCCVQAWMIYAAAIVLWSVVFPNSVSRFDMIARLAGSLAAQLFVYSAGLWLMRYRAMGWLMVVYLPIFVVLVLVALTANFNWPAAIIAGIYAALAAAGVWIFLDARRRWMVTELG